MNHRRWRIRHLTKETVAKAVAESTSYRQLMIRLDFRGGGAYKSVRSLVEKLDLDVSHFTGQGWSKGKTKADHPSIAKASEKCSVKMTGRPGRRHTKETRQKMSKSASDRSWRNGLVKTKWYEVFCPNLQCSVKVQGTWERDYALYLNEKRVLWTKDRKHSFEWKLSPSDIVRCYHPDFFLPETQEYIEIKGFMWRNEAKGVDDERKLRLVQEQNPDMKLRILMKADLISLGVLND